MNSFPVFATAYLLENWYLSLRGVQFGALATKEVPIKTIFSQLREELREIMQSGRLKKADEQKSLDRGTTNGHCQGFCIALSRYSVAIEKLHAPIP